jgi:uncharacterized protein (TIGR03083 family)
VASDTDHGPWVRALRASNDKLSGIVAGLDADGLRTQSYAKEWSVAQVLSHLGSGAEIFLLNLNAGLSGGEPPKQEDYQAIWADWNARSPEEQAAGSIAANEALVERVESLSEEQLAAFRAAMFGMTLDAATLLRMRLSEHAVHTWDVAVALHPAARVEPYAVDLLIDGMSPMMRWMGKQAADPQVIAIATSEPPRTFTLDTGGVTLTPGTGDAEASGSLDMPAELLLRLVYGRVDDSAIASGEVRASDVSLTDLQAVFPGF